MPIDDMNSDQLKQYRDDLSHELEANQHAYDKRYGDAPANYAASINDDYNGSSEELARLNFLLWQIDLELRCRHG